jgi:hypothetical protein
VNKFLITILAVILVSCVPKLHIDANDGSPGNNGHNSLFGFVSNDPICTAGGSLVTMGLDKNDNGVLDLNEIQYSSDVCNGLTGGVGPTGPAGAPAPVNDFIPVNVIEPCGASSAQYKEVLLGLSGGGILSEFTGPGGIANVFIPDGSYYDTDTSACNFNVSTNPNGDRSITWDGSSHAGGIPYNSGSASYNEASSTWTVSY